VLGRITTFLWSYFRTAGIRDVVDILVVAYLIYAVLSVIHRTSAGGVIKGILLVLAALWVSSILRLTLIGFLLRQIAQIGAVALIVLFQPELRRFLESFGGRFKFFAGKRKATADEEIVETVVAACCDLARTKTGALIVFEKTATLSDYVTSGTVLSAVITAELLKNIFFPNTPLHDGAVLIREGKILAAACMLPLSSNSSLPKDLGMRHHAAVGITERCDAISVVVSEETGSISVADGGIIKRHLTRESLLKLLRSELVTVKDSRVGTIRGALKNRAKNG
jgi:diadenylate cyclase